MRKILLISCLGLLASFATSSATTLGVYADVSGNTNVITAETGVTIPIFLVAKGGIDPSGMAGFQCRVVPSDNVTIIPGSWGFRADGQNLMSPPDMVVAFPVPRPTAQTVVLAEGRCTLDNKNPGFIKLVPVENCFGTELDPYYIPGDPDLIESKLSFAHPEGDFTRPVLIINNCESDKLWSVPGISGPSWRTGYSMVYAEDFGFALLFGGKGPLGEYLNDLWFWNGNSWHAWPQTLDPVPDPRKNAAMAYDIDRQKLVLFGGHGERGLDDLMDDTWEFDPVYPGTWTEMPVLQEDRPAARAYNAMAYDQNHDVCVMYGGVQEGGRNKETWEWDGTNWNRTCQSCAPNYRQYQGMVYDESLQSVLMYGGEDFNSYVGDTWQYNGNGSWTQVATTGPEARIYPAMAYDPLCGGAVMFGGRTTSGVQNDIWIFRDSGSGHEWSRLYPEKSAPEARYGHSMVYDLNNVGFITFGGTNVAGDVLGNTWFFGPEPTLNLSGIDTGEEMPGIRGGITNYPNPFNPRTTIHFSLEQSGPVRLTVFDVRGRTVKVLVDEPRQAGVNETSWDGTDETGGRVASGAYFYRLITARGVFVGKMALLK